MKEEKHLKCENCKSNIFVVKKIRKIDETILAKLVCKKCGKTLNIQEHDKIKLYSIKL